MQIVKLMLFATQPFNPIYRRAYKTHVTADAMNTLDQVTQGGRNLTKHAISQVASQFVSPSAEAESEAQIVGGWAHPRYRFVMEAIEGGPGTPMGSNEVHAYYIGHTDYSEGATILKGGGTVLIDPKLNFYVDSVHRLRAQNFVQNGVQQNRWFADSASQILYGTSTLNDIQRGAPGEYRMRPVDVFRSQETLNQMHLGGYLGSEIKTIDTTGAMIFGGEFSSRANNSPGSYLYDVLDNYQQAINRAETYGSDENQVIREATSACRDKELYQDPFITMMRDNAVMTIQSNGQFSFEQLCRVAPHVDEVTVVFNPHDVAAFRQQQALNNPFASNVWGAHNTAAWHGSNIETVAATLLANAVPTIMLESLGASIRFNMTNMTADGQIQRGLETFTPLTNMVDSVMMANRILDRIQIELIPKVSQNNGWAFALTVDSSVTGETMIHISLNGQEAMTYVMPTFADNAASPVLTQNVQNYQNVTNDIYSVACNLFNQHRVSQGIVMPSSSPGSHYL